MTVVALVCWGSLVGAAGTCREPRPSLSCGLNGAESREAEQRCPEETQKTAAPEPHLREAVVVEFRFDIPPVFEFSRHAPSSPFLSLLLIFFRGCLTWPPFYSDGTIVTYDIRQAHRPNGTVTSEGDKI